MVKKYWAWKERLTRLTSDRQEMLDECNIKVGTEIIGHLMPKDLFEEVVKLSDLETFRKIFIKTINKRLNIIDTRKATNPSQRKVRKARINELVLIKQRFEKEFKQKLVSE